MVCRLVPQVMLGAQAVKTISRSLVVAPGLLNPAGDNVIAVRIYSQGEDYPGGLYDSRSSQTRQHELCLGRGYAVGGVGWHHKHFQLTSEQSDEREAFLRFDGVCC